MIVKNFWKLLTLCTIFLRAEIHECDDIAEVISLCDSQTLVIFDIDNTLIEPKQSLGSDQWFYYMLQSHQAKGKNFEEAISEVLPLWMNIQHVTEVKTCQTSTSFIVHELQKKGINVIGLTTRSIPIAYRTVDQLQSVNIEFLKTAPHTTNFFVPLDQMQIISFQEPAYYLDGILFSGNNNKGELLLKFFKITNYTPNKVIFIDDKIKHLQDVEEKLSANKFTNFIGLRYNVCDKQVKNFDCSLADIQLNYFKKILSDEHARALLSR